MSIILSYIVKVIGKKVLKFLLCYIVLPIIIIGFIVGSVVFLAELGIIEDVEGRENNKRSSDILENCEILAKALMERNAHYSLEILSNDLEYNVNEAKYMCCATYVSTVLYMSGLITQENSVGAGYNIHWTGYDDGVGPMLLSIDGWKEVTTGSWEDMEPGDVLIHNGGDNGHVLIYEGNDAGGGKTIWDQACGVIGDNNPTGQAGSRSFGYLNECRVFRYN